MAATFSRFGFEEALTVDELGRLIARGEIERAELILRSGESQWRRAVEVPEIRMFFADAPVNPGLMNRASSRSEMTFTEPRVRDETDKRAMRRAFALWALPIAFAGFMICAARLRNEFRSAHWPTADALAIMPYVYEYRVGGVAYRNVPDDDDANLSGHFPVYYDPANPAESRMAAGVEPFTLLFTFFCGAAAAISALNLFFPETADAWASAVRSKILLR